MITLVALALAAAPIGASTAEGPAVPHVKARTTGCLPAACGDRIGDAGAASTGPATARSASRGCPCASASPS